MYPPLQNFIRVLEQANPRQKITLLTTTGKYTSLNQFKTSGKNIHITRLAQSGPDIGRLVRLYNYWMFYAGCVWHLLKTKPVMVYCFAGTRSKEAADFLRTKGYKVYELDGGIAKWKKESKEIVVEGVGCGAGKDVIRL